MATAIERQSTRPAEVTDWKFHTLTGIQILSVGGFAPEEVVRNEDLAELGYDADWIVQRTGIRERRRAGAGVATSDLAYEASVRCLNEAGVAANEVDLILLATVTPDTPMPSTACHLEKRLGARAAAMDINAACSGFMYALATGAQFIKTGAYQRVLVVGADIMSRTVNPEDSKTFPLFGDGAGAVLLGAGRPQQGLLSYTLGADGEGTSLLCISTGGSRIPIDMGILEAKLNYVTMDGRAVFKWAVRMVAETMREVIRRSGYEPGDVDAVVLHQANSRILDAAAADVGIDPGRLVMNLDRYGNTSAASIPLALAEACENQQINRGDLVLMCGFGAGLTWGGALVRW